MKFLRWERRGGFRRHRCPVCLGTVMKYLSRAVVPWDASHACGIVPQRAVVEGALRQALGAKQLGLLLPLWQSAPPPLQTTWALQEESLGPACSQNRLLNQRGWELQQAPLLGEALMMGKLKSFSCAGVAGGGGGGRAGTWSSQRTSRQQIRSQGKEFPLGGTLLCPEAEGLPGTPTHCRICPGECLSSCSLMTARGVTGSSFQPFLEPRVGSGISAFGSLNK